MNTSIHKKCHKRSRIGRQIAIQLSFRESLRADEHVLHCELVEVAVAQSLDVSDGSELATRYLIRGSGVLSPCWWIPSRSPHSRAIVARLDVTSAHSDVPLLDIDSSQLSYTRCDGARAVSVRESCADQCSHVALDLVRNVTRDQTADRAQIGTRFRRPLTSTNQGVEPPRSGT